jgi:hypothetical protein
MVTDTEGVSMDSKQIAGQIAKATRIKGAKVETTAKVPRIVNADGKTLAYVRAQKRGIRVHVQDGAGKERCATVATVAEAAKLTKSSKRR